MTCSAMPDDSQLALAPLEENDGYVRGLPPSPDHWLAIADWITGFLR